ncbi:hypothetical protein RRG08_013300 [Elysia crispata]|uniref:Uncharacterized protein n=1 Tax=Elysia crispata TaxID=231223 RepID=A0AAE1AX00_9GAST|nr:hypothetical protein RRG08_013300 [Elysia crispata]
MEAAFTDPCFRFIFPVTLGSRLDDHPAVAGNSSKREPSGDWTPARDAFIRHRANRPGYTRPAPSDLRLNLFRLSENR